MFFFLFGWLLFCFWFCFFFSHDWSLTVTIYFPTVFLLLQNLSKLHFLSNHLNAIETRTTWGWNQTNPFDTWIETPVELNNLPCVGCSDFPPLSFEVLICQNDKQAKARCLTEVLCVTTTILSGHIQTPFKEGVGAGNNLFSVEVTGVMLIIYVSFFFYMIMTTETSLANCFSVFLDS